MNAKLRRLRREERHQEGIPGTVEEPGGLERERGLPSRGEGASGRHVRVLVCYYLCVSIYPFARSDSEIAHFVSS